MKPLIDDCIEWTGCKSKSGYGKVKYKGKCVRAHRLIYCEANFVKLHDINGLSVLHACDNPSCVNPKHLKLGTHKENMQDKMQKGRHVQVRGEDQGASKLSKEDVVYIKKVFIKSDREFGASSLAREFNVSPSTINRIVNNKSWTHITSADCGKEVIERALPH